MLTNVALYWFTKTIATSLRIYRETALQDSYDAPIPRIEPPTGFLIAPRDLVMLPKAVAEERTNLKRWVNADRGGHFLPSENPSALVAEYREFFG